MKLQLAVPVVTPAVEELKDLKMTAHQWLGTLLTMAGQQLGHGHVADTGAARLKIRIDDTVEVDIHVRVL